MKIGKLTLMFVALTLVLNTNIIAQAESKKLMYQGMRQGISWTVYLLNKKFVKEVKLSGETRRLYLVDEETKVSNGEVSQQTILIQCSTSQPFVTFKDSYEQQMAIIDFINPGEEPGGFNSGSYSTY